MKLESEFEVFDDVYILKDSDIIKTNVRLVVFPNASRFDTNPGSSTIQYGCCTKDMVCDGMQESESWYDFRFASQMGKTKKELLEKLLKQIE